MASLYEAIAQYENSGSNALYFEGNTFAYKEILTNIRKMISYFEKEGIQRKDVVTVVLPNIPATIYSFYALNAMDVVQNIIHPLTAPAQIVEAMERTGSQKAVILATTYADNKEFFDSCPYTFFLANPMHDNSFTMRHMFYLKYKKAKENAHIRLLDKFHRFPEGTPVLDKDNRADSIYLHSGGTTGIPKVIALSDDSINHLAQKVDGIIPCSIAGKSMLAVLPTFHGFGLGMGIHAPLANGAASALMMKFNSGKVIDWINENKVNFIIGVPLLYQKLAKDPKFVKARLSNLEYCFIGGDNVPPSLIAEYNTMMKELGSSCMLLEGYGLTETVTVCSVNTKEDFRTGSVGKPLHDIRMCILDEEMAPVETGTVGEVYVTGNTLMNGYLNDAAATEATKVQMNGEDWIKTGDLGYLDEDGFLFLKGRKKRMFKISGMNIYPGEVEKIATDLDCVHDASLEFFEEPNPHMILFVIKNHKTELSSEEIKEQILSALSEKLLKYSLPKEIVFMDEFPKTNVGKIDHKAFENPGL